MVMASSRKRVPHGVSRGARRGLPVMRCVQVTVCLLILRLVTMADEAGKAVGRGGR